MRVRDRLWRATPHIVANATCAGILLAFSVGAEALARGAHKGWVNEQKVGSEGGDIREQEAIDAAYALAAVVRQRPFLGDLCDHRSLIILDIPPTEVKLADHRIICIDNLPSNLQRLAHEVHVRVSNFAVGLDIREHVALAISDLTIIFDDRTYMIMACASHQQPHAYARIPWRLVRQN